MSSMYSEGQRQTGEESCAEILTEDLTAGSSEVLHSPLLHQNRLFSHCLTCFMSLEIFQLQVGPHLCHVFSGSLLVSQSCCKAWHPAGRSTPRQQEAWRDSPEGGWYSRYGCGPKRTPPHQAEEDTWPVWVCGQSCAAAVCGQTCVAATGKECKPKAAYLVCSKQ